MVVCSNLHADLPSSAFNVSLPILLLMTPPFNTLSSTLIWCMGVVTTDFESATGCREEKVQLSREMRPTTAMRRTAKRRVEVVAGVGMVCDRGEPIDEVGMMAFRRSRSI